MNYSDLLSKKHALLVGILAKTEAFIRNNSGIEPEPDSFTEAYSLLYSEREDVLGEIKEIQMELAGKPDIEKAAGLALENDSLINNIVELDKKALEIASAVGVTLKSEMKSIKESRNISLAYNASYSANGYYLDKKN